MATIRPEYLKVVTRFTERLARITPGMAPHLDDSAEIDAHLFGTPGGDRQDAAVDDVAAINRKIQQQD